MVRVQRIRVPDTGHLSWIVVDGEHLPVAVLNEYLFYLHRLGRSPNTVRAYAHHLQSFWAFLVEQDHDWQSLKLTQLAEFVSWVRHATRAGRTPSFRCHDQSDPRGHRFVLRVPGQAGGRDGDQPLAPLWCKESVQAVPAPHQPDTILATCGRSGSCDQASPRVFSPSRFNLCLMLAHGCGIDFCCACCMRAGCGSGKLWAFAMPTSDLTTAQSTSYLAQTATALWPSRARRMWCMSRNRRWRCTQTTWFMNIERLRTTMSS